MDGFGGKHQIAARIAQGAMLRRLNRKLDPRLRLGLGNLISTGVGRMDAAEVAGELARGLAVARPRVPRELVARRERRNLGDEAFGIGRPSARIEFGVGRKEVRE
jgi:hypothetical protein